MKVISNSSVLIALSSIGRLELLRHRFPEGLLIWGKRQGLFPGLATELSLLRREGGFRLSKIVYEYALQQVGE
jgi:predicted nucleic acid-binding protein